MGKINVLNKLVVFSVETQQFALSLDIVERVVGIVEIKPIPDVPECISGIINFEEQLIPVVNMRKLFVLPEKDIDLNSQLIIVQTVLTKMAFWVDMVTDIVDLQDKKIDKPGKILFNNKYVEGILKIKDNIVFIHDPDILMTEKQIILLKKAIEKQYKIKDKHG